MRSALLVSLLLVACGSSPSVTDAGLDAGTLPFDAGLDAGASGRYPDGGTMYRNWDGGTCAVKADCPCFSSDDCGPGFVCRSEDSTGLAVYCVPGERGDGGVGAPCQTEADCVSALCIDRSAGSFCSAICSSAADCVPSLPRCLPLAFGPPQPICAP